MVGGGYPLVYDLSGGTQEIAVNASVTIRQYRWSALLALFAGLLLIWAPTSGSAAGVDVQGATSQQLLKHLADGSWKIRTEALKEVTQRRLMQAMDQVVELAKADEHEKVRGAALHALLVMESSWLLPTAEHMAIEDPLPSNRRAALQLIGELGEGSRSSMVLGRVLAADRDEGLRLRAVEILRDRGWGGVEEQLAGAALRDGDVLVRRACRRALAEAGDEQHRGVLHRILHGEPNKRLRLEMAELIEAQPMVVDREALLLALHDSYAKVALSALRSLLALGGEALAEELNKKAAELRDRAVIKEVKAAAVLLDG
ncbi:MAG: hypothetical protein CMP23_03765 [Rickettsiales bacterium]|nr:hypothetical protein [Rickettsiales bacterium]